MHVHRVRHGACVRFACGVHLMLLTLALIWQTSAKARDACERSGRVPPLAGLRSGRLERTRRSAAAPATHARELSDHRRVEGFRPGPRVLLTAVEPHHTAPIRLIAR